MTQYETLLWSLRTRLNRNSQALVFELYGDFNTDTCRNLVYRVEKACADIRDLCGQLCEARQHLEAVGGPDPELPKRDEAPAQPPAGGSVTTLRTEVPPAEAPSGTTGPDLDEFPPPTLAETIEAPSRDEALAAPPPAPWTPCPLTPAAPFPVACDEPPPRRRKRDNAPERSTRSKLQELILSEMTPGMVYSACGFLNELKAKGFKGDLPTKKQVSDCMCHLLGQGLARPGPGLYQLASMDAAAEEA